MATSPRTSWSKWSSYNVLSGIEHYSATKSIFIDSNWVYYKLVKLMHQLINFHLQVHSVALPI